MQKNTRTAAKRFVALLFLIAAGLVIWSRVERSVYPREYADLVIRYARAYQLPESLLFALIRTESGFRADAVSEAGARGLTQITPETFVWLQSKTGETLSADALFESATAVRYGAFLLHNLLAEYGDDRTTALAAYHAGRGQVRQWLTAAEKDTLSTRDIPSPKTQHYVKKVLGATAAYQRLYAAKAAAHTQSASAEA
jgi:soluble lytic murein transglycosylase